MFKNYLYYLFVCSFLFEVFAHIYTERSVSNVKKRLEGVYTHLHTNVLTQEKSFNKYKTAYKNDTS